MSHIPDEPTRVVADPADSMLISLARAVAGGGSIGGNSWPSLDLADPKQREFGDYELLEEIGRGGMGVVYRARQRSLDREVAIKFIADWYADPSGIARFLAEARAAARLLHPNIVPVHEVGSVEGMHYFSMPLIRGHSLASLMGSGTLPTATSIALMLKLCDAIDYAHRLGLLHLDLKPANVLLDAREEPLVADFGLARHMDDENGVDAQEVSGTPSFMAPEQILIKQYRLTRATDIYALGAILYRCLTGVSPHGEGNADAVIRRAAAGSIRPPREVDPKIPRDLDAICMKCLELQPTDRYASAAQLADDLRRARDGLPVSVRRVGTFERMQRWFRREPRLAAALTLAVLALLTGAAATTWQWKRAVTERDRAAIASEIGARLYAYKGDDDGRADDLIGWLRKRMPGDEERQADALAAFARSVDAENPDSTVDLLGKVVAVLGADYRQRMIRSLEAGAEPHRHLFAALLAWSDESESADPRRFTTILRAAIADQPADRLVWHVAATYCPGPKGATHCLVPDAAAKLTQLDPDNMYPWLLLATASADGKISRDALHEAAQRSRFDDYAGETVAAYQRAVETAAVPAPPLIARPVQIYAPNERAEPGIALTESERQPRPWARLMSLCGINQAAPIVDPQLLSDCRVVGERMMRSDGSLWSRMFAVAIVKRLDKGQSEADEATRVRALYTYLEEVGNKVGPSRRASYPALRLMQDIESAGEMVALQRRARYFGYPDRPPSDWKPADPTALQSSRERYDNAVTMDHDADRLIAQGRYAEAVARLAPVETSMRQLYVTKWLRVRYLIRLGKARSGQHDFAAANAALGDAWNIAYEFGPGSREARDCAQAMVDLYTAWEAAEQDRGYDIKAGEWKQTLATFEATKDD